MMALILTGCGFASGSSQEDTTESEKLIAASLFDGSTNGRNTVLFLDKEGDMVEWRVIDNGMSDYGRVRTLSICYAKNRVCSEGREVLVKDYIWRHKHWPTPGPGSYWTKDDPDFPAAAAAFLSNDTSFIFPDGK